MVLSVNTNDKFPFVFIREGLLKFTGKFGVLCISPVTILNCKDYQSSSTDCGVLQSQIGISLENIENIKMMT